MEYQEKKKIDKVEHYLQQETQGPYNICTKCHRSLYQCSVRLYKHENIFSLQKVIIQMKLLDEKLYICEPYQKQLNKYEIPFQVVCKKMAVDSILDELKVFKKIEKVLSSKRILF